MVGSVDPFQKLPLLPSTVSSNFVHVGEPSTAFLKAVAPMAFVFTSIWPGLDSIPMFTVYVPLTVVRPSIWPGEFTLSVKPSHVEVTDIPTSICPDPLPDTSELVVQKVSL
jgi:hypothetical protein